MSMFSIIVVSMILMACSLPLAKITLVAEENIVGVDKQDLPAKKLVRHTIRMHLDYASSVSYLKEVE